MNSIIYPGAELTMVSNQFRFTEGPATDKEGNVFFTDQPNNTIWRYGIDGILTIFLEKAGRSNGLHFDNDGNLIACADELNELWLITPGKKVTVLVKDYKLNGPNNVWVHPNGDLYFTDPYYIRPYWPEVPKQKEEERVYLLSKSIGLIPVIHTLEKPNGILGSKHGKCLYVAHFKGDKTYKYAISKDGSLGPGEVVIVMGSDGMTIDNQGIFI